MKTFLRVALAIVAATTTLGAVSEAYPRTAFGDRELKTLPAARWMRTESSKDYFSADNGLFMQLFRYIDSNKIPMTAPVEAGIRPGTMVFYLDEASAKRADCVDFPHASPPSKAMNLPRVISDLQTVAAEERWGLRAQRHLDEVLGLDRQVGDQSV